MQLPGDGMTKQMTDGTKDKETGKDRRPSFKATLEPDEMKALVKHVRAFKAK